MEQITGLKTSDYYFDLPQELIAQDPLTDRTASRLLVMDRRTGKIEHRIFGDITDYLQPGDTLVLNDTILTCLGVLASHCRGFSCCGALALGCRVFSSCGSQALRHRLNNYGTQLSCSMACGIFPDQGLNGCPLLWRVDSSPLSHQRSPICYPL